MTASCRARSASGGGTFCSIRLHDTRHIAASLMLAAGEAPKVVAELLGHYSPTITVNVYQHLMPGMGEAAATRLTGLLGGMPA
jgi:integrase